MKKLIFLLLIISVNAGAQVVTDFTDVTDSLQLHFNSVNAASPTEIFNGKTRPMIVTLPAGKDQVYMSSNRHSNPKPFEKYMQFSAKVDSISLTNQLGITLGNVSTKQSRILIDKSTITGTPTITINGKTYAMFNVTKYWYAYVYGSSCKINGSVFGGGTISRTVNLKPGETYVVTFVTVSVKTLEVFTKRIDL